MTKKIKIGLIGAGRIGQVHAKTLAYYLPQVDLVAVSDIYEEAAQKCAATFHIPKAYKDHRKILEDKTIDAVVVCSSTDTHVQMIEEAAIAKKHVFCEKPIALNLKQIDQVLKTVQEHNIKLQIGFNRRFDPNFKQVHDMVVAGEVGQPHILRITSRDPSPPPIEYVKVSGGIFLDMTIHDFDMARYLIGSEVTEVYASGGVMVDPAIGEAGDIDTVVITLRFENGTIGVIDNSRQAVYGYDQRVEVFGSKGNIAVSNNTPHTAVHSNVAGVHSALPLHFFLERYMESYTAEMKAFINSICEDSAPSITGIDGRIPVVMGLAAYKSHQENRPVKLSEVDIV